MPAVRAAALLLLCAALPAAAGMYKIVGADGSISYADRAPADAPAARVTEVKIRSYTGPARLGVAAASPDWTAILRRPLAAPAAAAPGAGLVMFSTPTCGHCKKAKQYMNAAGIAYTELDITRNDAARDEYSRLGGHGVPFFVAGGKTLTGFSADKLDSLLGRAP